MMPFPVELLASEPGAAIAATLDGLRRQGG